MPNTLPSEQLFNLVAAGGYYLLLGIFVVHVVFLAYHWFNYGTHRTTSLIALATYLGGGAVLLLTMSVLIGKI